eukprot:CAMPEP_0117667896 /NCGR_PEP_ID=MMETSP0804-20121206/11229_1 /TAXON_ID=1074897 /ORGANISM="Tetraselmis astigmatica, Strain CCMP880" /LENGTH=321 /DNA_ID=CAMNT_0005475689 /DNA_START=307 /DNA_END=1272 /DNA_ORIENTATION=-
MDTSQSFPPPVDEALPPADQVLPPVDQVLPPVDQVLPPVDSVAPPPPSSLNTPTSGKKSCPVCQSELAARFGTGKIPKPCPGLVMVNGEQGPCPHLWKLGSNDQLTGEGGGTGSKNKRKRDPSTYNFQHIAEKCGKKICQTCGVELAARFGTGKNPKPCPGKIADPATGTEGPCPHMWKTGDSQKVKRHNDSMTDILTKVAPSVDGPMSGGQALEAFNTIELKAAKFVRDNGGWMYVSWVRNVKPGANIQEKDAFTSQVGGSTRIPDTNLLMLSASTDPAMQSIFMNEEAKTSQRQRLDAIAAHVHAKAAVAHAGLDSFLK